MTNFEGVIMQLTAMAPRACRILAAALLPLSAITPASAYLLVDASSIINNNYLLQDRVTLDSTNGYQAGDTIQSLTSFGPDLSRSRAKADYGTLGFSTEVALDPTIYAGQVKSEAQADWYDTVTIGGAAPGATVKLLATIVLDVSQFDAATFGTYTSASSLIQMTTNFGATRIWCGMSAVGTFGDPNGYCSLIGSVGSIGVGRNEISFEVETIVGAHDWGVNMDVTSYVQSELLNVADGGGSANVNSLNTAHSYFTVLTPGATMQWESGHDYSLPPVSAVPEPSTHALIVAGLGALGFVTRRRRRH